MYFCHRFYGRRYLDGHERPPFRHQRRCLVDFETVVLPIPQFDTEHPRMISQGPSVCIFNKEDSQEVLASWLFTQYLLTNEVQIAYSETEGYVPLPPRHGLHRNIWITCPGAGRTTVPITASKLMLQSCCFPMYRTPLSLLFSTAPPPSGMLQGS